jgi:type I restriction-modification system DNA methylase subunit
MNILQKLRFQLKAKIKLYLNIQIIYKNMSHFSELTERIQRSLPKDTRKKQGIYFTPNDARTRLCSVLRELKLNPTSILEPSFGTAEFLNDMKELYPDAELFGVEQNEEIFDQVIDEIEYDADLMCMDFLEYEADPVELIIGNPPYFVTTLKNPNCMSGRGNIFILFLYKCLTEHLRDDGVLAFVLPTSLYNCAYYQKCRLHCR